MSELLTEIDQLPTSATDFALFSGGNDSVVSTHKAHDEYDIDYTVYLDTNSGLPANKEHVKDVCEKYGWDLLIAQSPVTLKEFALGTESRKPLGFPLPSMHTWAYQYFKERQLGSIATHTDDRPRYYAGVRTHESERRMNNVTGKTDEGQRWTWVNPIWNWRDERVDDYREGHNLPKNPVAERIGQSGDCYCGAFDDRQAELVELEAHYPDHAEWLMNLEDEVQEELGTDESHCYWGIGGMDKKEMRALMAENDEAQMPLCSKCGKPDYPNPE